MGATGIKSDFSGFARIVQYTKVNGAVRDMTETYDGLIKRGDRKGFGRYIAADPEKRTSFIGAMDGDYATGKGLLFKDFDPRYVGVWSNAGSRQKYTARPAATFWFSHFGQEAVTATEPEIDPDTGIRTWPDGSETYADGTAVADVYGDRGGACNAYLIDECQREEAAPSYEESEPEEEEDEEGADGDDADGEYSPVEEECEWDDDECWENLEYDWQAEDDDMFAWEDDEDFGAD